MKKARNMFVLALVLLSVISIGSVAGTYAKYTSTFEGTSDSATVAKWAFEINDSAVDNTFDFDLFKTITEADGSTAEDNVADTKIAPGTGGKFEIKLANKSEVDAEYTVAYTITNDANIPVEFSIDGGTTWTTGLDDVTSAVAINRNAEDTIAIQWRWAFTGTASENYTASQTDETDTNLGKAGTASISVKAAITANQVD